MASTLVFAYLAVALAVAAAVSVASDKLGDHGRPAPHRTGLCLTAGAVWPLLLMGLIELTSLALCARARARETTRRVTVAA